MTEILESENLVEIEEEEEAPAELEAGKTSRQQDGFDLYLRKINKYPLLTVEEEYDCINRWQESRDSRALDKLVNSHLRLVARIAAGYKGYGLPMPDLVSEGSVGMMQAVDRFDTERGFRFSTYASWWIQSAIKEYVLRMWSMVRLGSTATQKKLFFQLRRLKQQLRAAEANEIPDDYIDQISQDLNVNRRDVMDMNLRLAGPDFSLNAPLAEEEGGEWMDILEDERDDQETAMMSRDETSRRSHLLAQALQALSPREYKIFFARHLSEDPLTLATMADELGLSRERIRQIEAAALNKVKRAVKSKAIEQRMIAY
jgi:RNA polymerase sigma-32 factor